MPKQSNRNTSPATLHLFGVTHTIALDGTVDGMSSDRLFFSEIGLLTTKKISSRNYLKRPTKTSSLHWTSLKTVRRFPWYFKLQLLSTIFKLDSSGKSS